MIHVYIFILFSIELIVSVVVCRSSVDIDNFLALRLVLMILIGAVDGAIVCKPTCLLFIVCITCYKMG